VSILNVFVEGSPCWDTLTIRCCLNLYLNCQCCLRFKFWIIFIFFLNIVLELKGFFFVMIGARGRM
jgi:hypothetical protein